MDEYYGNKRYNYHRGSYWRCKVTARECNAIPIANAADNMSFITTLRRESIDAWIEHIIKEIKHHNGSKEKIVCNPKKSK
jgi:hypothetical protein